MKQEINMNIQTYIRKNPLPVGLANKWNQYRNFITTPPHFETFVVQQWYRCLCYQEKKTKDALWIKYFLINKGFVTSKSEEVKDDRKTKAFELDKTNYYYVTKPTWVNK